MIQDHQTTGQSGIARIASAQMQPCQGYVPFPYELMDSFHFTDKDDKVRKLSTSERAVLAALLRDLHRGCPAVKTKQIRLVDKAGVCERVVRDALHALNLAGLVVSTIIRNGKKRIIGSHHDMSNTLRKLPEKTLRSLNVWDRLTPDLPAKNTAAAPPDTSGQGELPLDDDAGEFPSQMDAEGAPEGAENEQGDDMTYRQDTPHSDRQKQTLFVKQHTHDDEGKPLPDPNTDRGVVALLAAKGVEWKRAWKCVRKKNRKVCLEWLAALPYLTKRGNVGGFLAAAILDGYKFPAAYLAAVGNRDGDNKHRAAPAEPQNTAAARAAAQAARDRAEAEQNARLTALSPAEQLTLARECLAQTRPDASLGLHLRRFIDAIVAKPSAPVPPVSHFVQAALVAKLMARKDC